MKFLQAKRVYIFFVVYLAFGLTFVPDFGMSWDERPQRQHGLHALDHVIEKLHLDWEKSTENISLDSSPGRQYTVLFSMTAAVLERFLGLTDKFRERYLMRHYMVFLLFWISSIYFYKLLKDFIQNQNIALLGTLLLILCPRIFAHSFYNPKDIVLLAFYIISSFTMLRFLQNSSVKNALWHALATAMVINARIPGIIIPALTFFLFFLNIIQNRFERSVLIQYGKSLPLYLVLSLLLTLALFPYLWLDPAANLIESFELMAHFPWGFKSLYFGEFYKASQLPWHFSLGWMAITLPPYLLLFFPIGVGICVYHFWKAFQKFKFWESEKGLFYIAMPALMLGPLAAIFLFNSNVYDDWRQLYFIFPPFLAIVIIGIAWLIQHKNKTIRYSSWVILFWGILSTSVFMIKNHPHQQVYFNFFAGKNLTERFDMDYWGLAYKQAFETLLEMDIEDHPLHVFCANEPCIENYKFLPENLKAKIKLRWGDDVPQYFLSNFRYPEQLEKFQNGTYPYVNEFFAIEVEGQKIIGVYKLREEPK